jgi:hypothetical protein
MCEVLEKASFEVIKTLTETLPDTVPDLGFNVDENGWKVSLPLYIVTTNNHRMLTIGCASGHHLAPRTLADVQGGPEYVQETPRRRRWIPGPDPFAPLSLLGRTYLDPTILARLAHPPRRRLDPSQDRTFPGTPIV